MKLVDLMPLQEIDFPNQRAFDQYNKIHKLRPDTEVTVAGRKTTAGRAALNSEPVKGTSVFGKGDDDMHPKLKDLYKQQFGKEPGEEKPMFPDAKKKDVSPEEILVIYKNKNRINKTKSFTDLKSAQKFADDNDGELAKIVNGKLTSFPSTSVLGKGEEPNRNEPFEGGDDVLNKVPELLPVGSGFTHKQTGNEIIVKGYKDNHMLVSYEKYPNKILKWPLKQFLKMTANKELQFHPKSK